MSTQTFTIYRTTNDFMGTLNNDADNLELHRQRISVGEKALKANRKLISVGHLIPCAKATCTIEGLFELTNTISRFWLDNKEVTMTDDRGFFSSSSMGDVFEDESGQLYCYTMTDIVKFGLERVAA
jgi:hypothetical protein